MPDLGISSALPLNLQQILWCRHPPGIVSCTWAQAWSKINYNTEMRKPNLFGWSMFSILIMMVRLFLGEKSEHLSSGICSSNSFACYGNAHFYALFHHHYLVRLTMSAPFSATPWPCYWSRQQRWHQGHVLGPESHGQCRRASQYQTDPEVFANIFRSCSFITKQNSCWCCVGLKENCKKRPCKSNQNYYSNKCHKGYGLGLLSDSGIIKPSGNVSSSGQTSQFLVFLLPPLQTPDIIPSLLTSWETISFSHCSIQPNGCFSPPCSLCTQQYLHFQKQVPCPHLLFRLLFSIQCRALFWKHCSLGSYGLLRVSVFLL